MAKEEQIAEKLNDLILDFETASGIVNYAIVFKNRIVMAPNVIDLMIEFVEAVLKTIDVEKLEKLFNKSDLKIAELEFEGNRLYIVKCTPEIRIIAVPQKGTIEHTRNKLLFFAEKIKEVFTPSDKLTSLDESDQRINQALANLDAIINELEVPSFDSFKKLVKFAIPFQKKE